MRTQTNKVIAAAISAIIASGSLTACGTVQQDITRLENKAMKTISTESENAERARPSITSTESSFLLGSAIQVKPSPSPLLNRIVTYAPQGRVTLAEVAAYISKETGLIVDTSEIDYPNSSSSDGSTNTPITGDIPTGQNAPVVPALSAFNPMLPGAQNNAIPRGLNQQHMYIRYTGKVAGLLDVSANNIGGWWKFIDGRAVYYRTESKTFYLPGTARKFVGSNNITANSSGSGSSGSSGNGGGGGSTSSSGGSNTTSASSTTSYSIDVWDKLQETASAVGMGAKVVANKNVGSITVMGSPAQVRKVEEWVASLSENLSQQVQMTVRVFSVKISNEDNYGWNPLVVFNNAAGKYGLTMSGPSLPAVISGANPLSLSASVLSTATGGAGQYKGTDLAYQALSTLGRVTETFEQTFITQNNESAPLQIANQLSYLKSSQTTVSQGTGSTVSLQDGILTTGFTGMWTPRIANGRIFLSLDLTNSSLISMGQVTSGGSTIQTPNIAITTFQQSVNLRSGESLMISGIKQDKGSTNSSGVGSTNNYIFGGGVGNTTDKQLIAIVISAKVM